MDYKAAQESDGFWYVKDDINDTLCRCKNERDAIFIAARLNKASQMEQYIKCISNEMMERFLF